MDFQKFVRPVDFSSDCKFKNHHPSAGSSEDFDEGAHLHQVK
jgi:hypothetical protein